MSFPLLTYGSPASLILNSVAAVGAKNGASSPMVSSAAAAVGAMNGVASALVVSLRAVAVFLHALDH